jgi:hypothetical protein
VIVPFTVIMPGRHGVMGPSSTRGPGALGGAQTSPPGLGGVGAAQPARSASSFFSFNSGFGTRHSLRDGVSAVSANLSVASFALASIATSQQLMPPPMASRFVMER